MITCTKCQTPLPKWRAIFCSFRVRCPSCDTQLQASKRATREYFAFFAIALAALFACLNLIDFLYPEPSFADWIPVIFLLACMSGPSLLLWRRGHYSHQNPRFKFLGLNSNWWSVLIGLPALIFAVYIVIQSPYLRLNWHLPEEATIISHEQIGGFWSNQYETKVQVSPEVYESLVDSLEFRGGLDKDGSYLQESRFYRGRLRYEDGLLILEEWMK